MRLTTTLLTTFTLALVGCGDDGSPQPIDAAVDADPNAIDAPPVCVGGTLDYGADCTEGGTECGSCTCRNFGHEIKCVTTCTDVSECPPNTRRCQSGFCQPN